MNSPKAIYNLLALLEKAAVLYSVKPSNIFTIEYINPVFEKLTNFEFSLLQGKDSEILKKMLIEKKIMQKFKIERFELNDGFTVEIYSPEKINNEISALIGLLKITDTTCFKIDTSGIINESINISNDFSKITRKKLLNGNFISFLSRNTLIEKNELHKLKKNLQKNSHKQSLIFSWKNEPEKLFFLEIIPENTDISNNKYYWLFINNNQQKYFQQTEMKHSEEGGMFRQVLDAVPIRVYWKDKQLKYIGCNIRFAADMFVNKPDEIKGCIDSDLLYGFDSSNENRDDVHIIEKGVPKINYEEFTKFQDGRTIWLKRSKVPLLNINGEIIGLLGTYQDITAQKNAEMQLAESEARFSDMAGFLPQIIFEMDRNGFLTYVNKKANELFKNDNSFIGKHFTFLISDEQKSQAIQNLKRISEGVRSKGNRYDMKDFFGNPIPVNIYSTPFYDGSVLKGFRGLIVDIREELEAEAVLKQSETRFRKLFEYMSEAACLLEIIYNENGIINDLMTIEVNSNWCNLFGAEMDNFNNRLYSDYFSEFKFLPIDTIASILEKNDTYYFNNHFSLNGKEIKVSISSWEKKYCLIICNDITDLIKTMNKLQETKEMFRLITELTTDGASCLTIREDGKFHREWFYQGAFEFLGYLSEDIDTLEKWVTMIHPEDRHFVFEAMPKVLNGEKTVFEARLVSKDKTNTIWIRNTIFPVKDSVTGKVFKLYSSMRNIDELKR